MTNKFVFQRLEAAQVARQRAETAQQSAAQDAEHRYRRVEARHEAQLEVPLERFRTKQTWCHMCFVSGHTMQLSRCLMTAGGPCTRVVQRKPSFCGNTLSAVLADRA